MKIVLCNGCFDPFHWGHLQHLKQAKAMGDRLVVAVTRAGYVNKGYGRPVFSDEQRVEVMVSLRLVDYVFLVCDSLEALQKVKPDIFCKGAEYRGHIRKDHSAYCKANGIKIRFTRGKTYSSTELLNATRRG